MSTRWSASSVPRAILLLALLLALSAGALACDPDHDWKKEQLWGKRVPHIPLIRDAVLRILVDHQQPEGKILLLTCEDEYGAAPDKLFEGDEPRFLEPAERRARAAEVHRELVGALGTCPGGVVPWERIHAFQQEHGELAGHDPEKVRALARETGAAYVIRLLLMDYAHVFEREVDLQPKNKHLYRELTSDSARVRLAVLDPEGRYIVVDELHPRQVGLDMFWHRPGQEREVVESSRSPFHGKGSYFHKNESGRDTPQSLRGIMDSLKRAPEPSGEASRAP